MRKTNWLYWIPIIGTILFVYNDFKLKPDRLNLPDWWAWYALLTMDAVFIYLL